MTQENTQTLTRPRPDVENCPLCGARSIAPVHSRVSLLLTVSDVLMLKMLEALGRKIVREERGRFQILGDRPWHVAHTIWPPSRILLTRTLERAWEIVPVLLRHHGDLGVSDEDISQLLSEYACHLVRDRREHDIEHLASWFSRKLNLSMLGEDVEESP